MLVSLNEIDVSAKRAARGCGLSWGLAEEAGKAARWLCARGLPGVPALVPLLRAIDGKPVGKVRIAAGEWFPAGTFLCPILVGAAISDDAAKIGREQNITLHTLRAPLLLLPFLAWLAKHQGVAVCCNWQNATAVCSPAGAALSGEPRTELADRVEIIFGADVSPDTPLLEGVEPVEVEDCVWRELQTLAARTYVPASDRSRLQGAGAGSGLSDND